MSALPRIRASVLEDLRIARMMARDRQRGLVQRRRMLEFMRNAEGGGESTNQGLTEAEIESITLWGLTDSKVEINCLCADVLKKNLVHLRCGHWLCHNCMLKHCHFSQFCPFCNRHIINLTARPWH